MSWFLVQQPTALFKVQSFRGFEALNFSFLTLVNDLKKSVYLSKIF